MTATKRLSETNHKAGWLLLINKRAVPHDTEWEVQSPFGSVQTAVVMDENGSPVFDRPAYSEAPNVNVVAWGKTDDGEVRIAVISQPRPHADDPENPGDDHDPVVFGQIPMGFVDKITGETPEETAAREAGEEAGAWTVVNITQPEYPWQNPNPTFVKTWSELYFIEVNLDKVEELKSTRDEPIYSAEYISADELIRRMRDGKDSKGAVYRMCTANSAVFTFFATYPELWPK